MPLYLMNVAPRQKRLFVNNLHIYNVDQKHKHSEFSYRALPQNVKYRKIGSIPAVKFKECRLNWIIFRSALNQTVVTSLTLLKALFELSHLCSPLSKYNFPAPIKRTLQTIEGNCRGLCLVKILSVVLFSPHVLICQKRFKKKTVLLLL